MSELFDQDMQIIIRIYDVIRSHDIGLLFIFILHQFHSSQMSKMAANQIICGLIICVAGE